MNFRPDFDELYRLAFITRYSNMPRIRNESVAEHSFFVASITIQMRQILHFDLAKVVTLAIIHDWPEARVDDVSHKVKRDFPEVKKALRQAEGKIIEGYAPELQVQYRNIDSELQTFNHLILHLADAVQCVQYSQAEINLGNKYMDTIYKESVERSCELIAKIPAEKYMLGYSSIDLMKALRLA